MLCTVFILRTLQRKCHSAKEESRRIALRVRRKPLLIRSDEGKR
nr:MAG TPA: hypothetical protein [Caudoviricetes sp.]